MPDISLSLVFDRRRVRLHRDRAVRSGGDDFLLQEMALRVCEKLDELNRTFETILELGAHTGSLGQKLKARNGMHTLVQSDMSQNMIAAASGLRVVADEELLPFAEKSFDLVVSIGSMHWINDLPGTLIQIRRCLKPDGALVLIMPGGQTLNELRHAFEQAELHAHGGISPRVSPFLDAREAGSLLARAGFRDPVVDVERLSIEYDHPLKLLKELQRMGESNALIHSRKYFTPCSLMMLMADHYIRDFSNAAGRITATMELVTMTAWRD